jgi:LCP family protein required for cell wall assembly
MAAVAGIASGAIFTVSGALYAGYATFDGNLSRVDINGGVAAGPPASLSGSATSPDSLHPAMNVLLVGVDDRSNLSKEQLAEIATEDVGTALTDTIILAHLPAKVDPGAPDQAVLMSIPRDSWVSIPGYGMNKINSAYLDAGEGEEGAQALIATVENLSGLEIDHYVQVDLNGFLSIADAIGGVDVCLKHAVDDEYTQLVLPAGPQTLDGVDALRFVRQRHGLPQGDLDRIVRQQAFLSAALRKVTSAGTLLNPWRVNALLNATTDALVVDEGLTVDRMRDLAFSLKGIAAGDVEFRTIPVTGLGVEDGQSVVRLNDAELPAFFESLNELAPEPEPALDRPEPGAPVLTVPARDVSVAVRNGSGVNGAATKAERALQAKGFDTVGYPSNADRQDYETSVVFYGPGQSEAARTLATAVEGAETEYDESLGSTLRLVVGANFAGIRAITVPGDTPPPASPEPSEEPVYQSRYADDASCVN